jgi:hypothetical protein
MDDCGVVYDGKENWSFMAKDQEAEHHLQLRDTLSAFRIHILCPNGIGAGWRSGFKHRDLEKGGQEAVLKCGDMPYHGGRDCKCILELRSIMERMA